MNVGYPNQWDDLYDDVEFRSVEEGGSYFENVLAMGKAAMAELAAEQDEPVERNKAE